MEDLANRRALATRGTHAFNSASGTAEVSTIMHCLMMDAKVLIGEGRTLFARDLRAGEVVEAVAIHSGRELHGTCAVKSLKIFGESDRDLTTVVIDSASAMTTSSRTSTGLGDFSVRVTSNHAIMGKAPTDVCWGPVEARRLSSSDKVALRHQTRNGMAYGSFESEYGFNGFGSSSAAGETMATIKAAQPHTRGERACVQVVELVFDFGEAASWLRMESSSTSLHEQHIASYGDLHTVLRSGKHGVWIWGFSRSPGDYIRALTESEELEGCRRDLLRAGFSFRLPSGGFLFVKPSEAQLVIKALEMQQIRPRASEVVVAPEFETRLEQSLALMTSSFNVHPRKKNELRLDSAMGDILYFANGCPFRFITGGTVVQGRRTFIELTDDDTAPGDRTLEAPF